jgi:hypothetical protein
LTIFGKALTYSNIYRGLSVKKIGAVLLTIVALLMPSFTQAVEWEISPLPQELSKYYQRYKSMADVVYDIVATPEVEFSFYKRAILHDIGLLDSETSQIAKEYLMRNVIQPLTERKSVTLQDGRVVAFEELDRLALAQLIYYFCRDQILFFGEESEILRQGLSIPGTEEIDVDSTPDVCSALLGVRYPCETLAIQHGVCQDQATILAALLKLCGFEVALGYWPHQGPTLGTSTLYWPGAYHHWVFLKDEGWGIGHWKPGQDALGNPMDGNWILLDCIHSTAHQFNIQGRRVTETLEFGEDPSWTSRTNAAFISCLPCISTMPFCWFIV